MSNLMLRIISALVLGSFALGALYLGSWAWLALIAAAAVGLSIEWVSLVDIKPRRLSAVLLSISVLLSLYLTVITGIEKPAFGLLTLSVLLMFIGLITGYSSVKRLGFGLAYIGAPVLALYWLRNLGDGSGFIVMLWLLLVIWATDSFAYFAGRSIGGPKLFPKISPKKTWSGALGGVIGAAVTAMALHWFFQLNGSALGIAVISAAVSILSQFGDALESTIKRDFNVKDSGHIIPGHGGLFDRLDGLLVTAPVIAATMIIMNGGVHALIGDRL